MLRGSERETALSKLKKQLTVMRFRQRDAGRDYKSIPLRQKCSENLLHTSKTM